MCSWYTYFCIYSYPAAECPDSYMIIKPVTTIEVLTNTLSTSCQVIGRDYTIAMPLPGIKRRYEISNCYVHHDAFIQLQFIAICPVRGN